jgi:hypothetical protein
MPAGIKPSAASPCDWMVPPEPLTLSQRCGCSERTERNVFELWVGRDLFHHQ